MLRLLFLGLATTLVAEAASVPSLHLSPRNLQQKKQPLAIRAQDDYDPCDPDGPQKYYLRTQLKDKNDDTRRDNFDDKLLSIVESRTSPGSYDVGLVTTAERDKAYQFVIDTQGLRIIDEVDCSTAATSSKPKQKRQDASSGKFGCLGASIVGADPCGNGGCKTQQEYCTAVATNGHQDPCCPTDQGPGGQAGVAGLNSSSTGGGANDTTTGGATTTPPVITGGNGGAPGSTRYVVMGQLADRKLQQPMVVSDKEVSAGEFAIDEGSLVASSSTPEWDTWVVCDGEKGYASLYWVGVNPPTQVGQAGVVYIQPDANCSAVVLKLGDY